MRRAHFEAIAPVCPTCREVQQGVLTGVAHALVLADVFQEDGEHIVQGVLRCTNPVCLREYPIIDGVPMIVATIRSYVQNNLLGLVMRDDLAPDLVSILGDCAGPGSTLDVHRQHLSLYCSDHWGDQDPALTEQDRGEAGGAVRLLRGGLDLVDERPAGPVLDMGCSVGRTTFDLARDTDELVLGVDLNFSMLKVAARALREGRIVYDRRRVGIVYDRRDYEVDVEGAERVDFWQCDVMALPFSPGRFGLVTSLHLIDCVASPANHLHSLSELLRADGRAVIASPYDWSTAATNIEGWLGGHSQRAEHRGASEVVVRQWLAPMGLALHAEQRNVKWTVRLHARSTMHYSSDVMVVGPA